MTGRGRDTTTPLEPVEARLLAAAAAATWPQTPGLRDAVVARIEAATPDLRGPVVARIAVADASATRARSGSLAGDAPAQRSVRRPLVRGLALALVAVLAIAGVAAALGYRLPGLDIVFVESLPPAGVDLDLGSPVPLEEARAGEPHLLLPSALPDPSTAWVAGAGAREIVTVAWRAEPGQATLPGSDLSLLLMTVAGEADGAFVTKALPQGARIEPVSVGGDRGWWIAGPLHELLFRRPDGGGGVLPTRLAGDTLVFSRDGTLYRFESALGRDRTIAIADTLR